MEYRKLGRTDLSVSALCLGTMTFGQQNNESEGHAQLDYAFSRGVNFLDTAEIYSIPPRPETQGSTERIVGSWLKARGGRDKVIVATKVAGRGEMTWLRENNEPTRLDKKNIAYAVEQSLKRLHTTASLMMIVAHPDDEDGPLLTYLSRGLGVRCTLFTLTRGEGGQNAMSADSYDAGHHSDQRATARR